MLCEEHASLAAWKVHLDAAHARGDGPRSGACFNRSSCAHAVCLPAGTHIVFAGDSTTRYQYLQLAYALRHGVENLHDGPRSINSERSWPGLRSAQTRWGVFTNATSQLLHPHELCDCYRSTSDLHGFQHRYFHINGVSLTYIELMGRHEIHGAWWPATGTVSTCGAPRTLWAKPAHERMWRRRDWPSGLAELVKALEPSALVLNVGHHLFCPQGATSCDYKRMTNVSRSTAAGGALEFVTPQQSRIKPLGTAEWQRLRDAFVPLTQRTTVLWKTTSNTGSRQVPATEAAVAAQFFPRIFDAHKLSSLQLDPARDYWDAIHLKSRANNLMNWALLTQIEGDEWALKAGCTP
jgi:hypothetical protein